MENLKDYLGNLDALRDWGHAKDYVETQWLMLQQDFPKDYVISTGVQYSVRTFLDKCLDYLGKVYGQGRSSEKIIATAKHDKYNIEPNQTIMILILRILDQLKLRHFWR